MPGVVVLVDNADCHVLVVELQLETASYAFIHALTISAVALVQTVVVEQSQFGVVVDEAGVVLPAEVGRLAIAEILELVLLATENPDVVAGLAINELDMAVVSARDEIVAILVLGKVSTSRVVY